MKRSVLGVKVAVLAAALLAASGVVPGQAAAQTSTDAKPSAQTSTDAKLSALSVSPGSLSPAFASDTASYSVEVGFHVDEVTASWTSHASATVETLDSSDIALADADAEASGFQVALGERGSATEFKVKVTAQDTTTTETYTITVNRASQVDLGNFSYQSNINPDDDELPYPGALCSDGTTIWAADLYDDDLIAYNQDGTRDSDKDIELARGNDNVGGIWCNDTTVWVSDYRDFRVYAYTLSTGDRDAAREFTLFGTPRWRWHWQGGLWSDGTTIWVARAYGPSSRLYAFNLSTGNRDQSEDIRLNGYNIHPGGLWSDGTTIWVNDIVADKIFAYDLSAGAYDSSRNYNSLSDNNQVPTGLWFDADTMWVSDGRIGNGRIFIYQRVGGI